MSFQSESGAPYQWYAETAKSAIVGQIVHYSSPLLLYKLDCRIYSKRTLTANL